MLDVFTSTYAHWGSKRAGVGEKIHMVIPGLRLWSCVRVTIKGGGCGILFLMHFKTNLKCLKTSW